MAGTLIRRGNQHLMERVAGRITLLSGWQRALAAFASGAVAVAALPPFDFMAAGFVSFTVLVWLLDGATPEGRPSLTRRLAPAFITGWLFGFGYFLAGLWWIGNALLVEAEEFAWALPLAVLALPAALAIFYGLATVLARIFWSNDFGRILALAAGFGAAEWLRSVLFTGFPWNAIGYAAMPVPILMQPVAVIGLFGMNAIAVLIFSMPALLGTGRYLKTGLAVMLVTAASVLGFGYWRLAQPMEGKSVDVRIVQASVSQSGKWDGQLRDSIFRTHLQLSGDQSEGRTPQLVVWPETAVPFLFAERPDALVALSELLDENQILLAGAVRSEGGTISGESARFYNSIVAINDKGEIFDAADKVHLVPFGEYLPFSDFLRNLGIRELVTAPGIFSPSNARSLLEMPDGLKLLPMICYEIIFPGELEPLADNADAIINVTNDAWYGDTPGPYQHFRQAQVRAVEAGLPLIRAANNGLSAIVDSRGRIVDGLALDAVGVIDGPLLLARSPVFSWRNYSLVAILLLFATIACIMQISTRFRSN